MPRKDGAGKICRLCRDKVTTIDYKDEKRLNRYITEQGKMIPRRVSGNCTKHQHQISRAIKRARQIALLPFVGRHYRHGAGASRG